jgi:hypothetical protein
MKDIFKMVGVIALVAVIGFSMETCDKGNNSGKGTFTINNMPFLTTLQQVDVNVFDRATVPALRSEWPRANDSNYAYDGGSYLAHASKVNNPPYSTFTLSCLRHNHGIDWEVFDESGNFLVHIILTNNTKDVIANVYTVARFTNGSATVNWDDTSQYFFLPD